MKIKKYLPNWIKRAFWKTQEIFYYYASYVGIGRYCPICRKSSRRFEEFGLIKRKDAMCPNCRVLERHRLVWLYLTKNTNLFGQGTVNMLHIAAEPSMEIRFREKIGSGYLTADLYDQRAMVKMDVTDIQYSNELFDVILCSHVLEHVTNDKQAMCEFYRVLKNNGWAILLVPITAEYTIEDPSILNPEERLQLFGQEDHVRRYGPDFYDRLKDTGFDVKVISPQEFLNKWDIRRMGLSSANDSIYFCKKRMHLTVNHTS